MQVVLTPRAVILQSSASGETLALDRRTGAVWWRQTFLDNGARGAEQTAYLAPDHAEDVAFFVGNSLRAVDGVTGRQVWALPPVTAGQPVRSLLAAFPGVVAFYNHETKTLELRSALTGEALPPERPGSSVVPFQATGVPDALPVVAGYADWSQFFLLSLTRRTLTPILVPPVRTDYPIAIVGLQADRLVLRYDLNDGYAGHSVYPKYLTAFDARGQKRWQFPARFTYADPADSRAKEPSVSEGVLVAPAGIVVAASDRLYGVGVADGRVRWAKNLFGTQPHGDAAYETNVVAYGRGVFVLVRFFGKERRVSLAYLDGATGRTRWMMRLPTESTQIAVDGDDLLILFATSVRDYSCRRLLGQTK